MRRFFAALFILEGLVALQGWFAYHDSFFTVAQMHGRGVAQGLPFLYHFGITLGDTLFVSPLLAFLVANYGRQWRTDQVLWAGGLSVLASAGMHYQYTLDFMPIATVYAGRLTLSGWMHFVYMAGAFTILLLFYLRTVGLSPKLVIGASVGLFLHLVVGTHMVLKVWSPEWFPPQPVADTVTLVVWAGAAFALALLSCFALIRRQ